MKTILSILIICLGLSFTAKANPCQITPVRLTCEMMESPNCVDVPDPVLSWINNPINSEVKGAGQSAYRIRVASSREKLAKADLWDTKKVNSDESVFIPYQGKSLSSGCEIWWQVKVWDNKGKASEWSKPACWRTGIMNHDEWCAQWIGAPPLSSGSSEP